MPKPIRDTIGEINCPCCGRASDVRQDGAGKLYLMCLARDDYEGCGKLTPNLTGGQAWVRDNMRRLEAPRPGVATFRRPAAPAPAPAPVAAPTAAPIPEPIPAAEPAPVPAPAPRASVFDKLWNASL